MYIPCKEDYSEKCRPNRNGYVEKLKWKPHLGIRSRESDWNETHKSGTFSYNIPCECGRGFVRVQQSDHLRRRKSRYILKEVLLGKSKLAQQTWEEDYRMSWSEARILSIEEQEELIQGTGTHCILDTSYQPKLGVSPMWIPLRGNANIQQGMRVNVW